jgi:hypothetical protein
MTKNFNINNNSKNTTVSYIDNNPYRFTYIRESLTSDKKTIEHIDIPNELKGESLFMAFAAYSKEQEFLNLSSGSANHYGNTLNTLIEFFSKNLNLLIEKNKKSLSVHYLVHLKDDLHKSSDSANRKFACLRMIFDFATDPLRSFFKSDHYEPFLKDLKSELPKKLKSNSNPKKTFSDVFKTEYTDDQVLMSMRRVLVWFIKTMQNIREEYLAENYDLAKSNFNIFDDGKTPHLNSIMTMASSSVALGQKKMANGYHLRSMLNLKSKIVNEMMFYANRKFNRRLSNGDTFNTWEIRRELEENFTTKEGRKKCVKGINRVNHLRTKYRSRIEKNTKFTSITQSVLPVGILFTTTLSERRAFAWLLASDRIQQSGFDKATLDDVLLDGYDSTGIPNKIQIRFNKGRSSKPDKADKSFNTPIYQRGKDEIFDVYYTYYLLRKNEEKHFSKIERAGYLSPSKWNKLYQRPASLSQSTTLPLYLLGLPNTEMYRLCVQNVEMAEPFLEILNQSVLQSTRYTAGRSLKKMHGKELTEQNLPISMDLIAQTRAVMEDDESDQPRVTAEMSAHSLKTHNDTYIDRSDITKKTDSSIHTFGSDVGDKIYDLAKKMGEIVKSESDYNRTELIEKLGLCPPSTLTLDGSNEINEVINEAKSRGMGTGLIDEINISTDTFIVQDPVIATIIMSYINHLERIKTKISDNNIKLKLVISHQIYLESLLEKFHRKHIKKAKELVKEIKLPYRKKI